MRNPQCSTLDLNCTELFRFFARRSRQTLDCRKIATTWLGRTSRHDSNYPYLGESDGNFIARALGSAPRVAIQG